MHKAHHKVRLTLIVLLTLLSPLALSSNSPSSAKCPHINQGKGQCIKVGEHSMYVNVIGDQGPSVVFESGRGESSDSWDLVAPTVAKFARVFTYDRSGLGFSQASNQPATAKNIARNLKILLTKRHIKPPYVLVGHSDGGLFVQMFARLYPKLTAAVIFVDAASQNQTFTDPLPKKTSRSFKEAAGFSTTIKQLKQAPEFPPVPVIVLTATWHGTKDPNTIFHMVCNERPCSMTEGQDEVLWVKLQNELAALSPISTHIFAYDSGHHIQTYQPKLVIDAVFTALQQIKRR